MFEVFDSHNKVLSAWAKYRHSLDKAPRLITLDHHTDTSPPFREIIGKKFQIKPTDLRFDKLQKSFLEKINFSNYQTVDAAIKELSNDEHIVTAIKTDIISSAFVLAHNAANTDLETYSTHKIVCRTVNQVFSKGKNSLPDYDTVIESNLIDKTIEKFNEILTKGNENLLLDDNYILDIDLDYFNTFKSIHPENPERLVNLAKNAGLITIATEPEYVKNCAIDPDLTSEYLLVELKKYLPS